MKPSKKMPAAPVDRLDHAMRSCNVILQGHANFEVKLVESFDGFAPAVVKLRYAGVVPIGTSDHVAFLNASDLRAIAKQLLAIGDNLCQ